MQLTVSSPLDTSGSLLLETGPLAGRRYRLEVRVCANPVCECEQVALDCFPETGEPLQPQPATANHLEMDLTQRIVANLAALKADPAAFALAKAVESEISEPQWTKLGQLYSTVKQHATEQADPDQLEVHFPPEVLAGDGSMVGYYEILPYAKAVAFTVGMHTWFLDDQYCVEPKCTCSKATLSFIQLPSSTRPDRGPIGPSCSIRYAYDTGRIERLPGASSAGLSGQELLSSLIVVQPELNSLLAKRHSTLRQLYLRALTRKTPTPPPSKPSRNAPCPCGSGKKYKRCCGAT